MVLFYGLPFIDLRYINVYTHVCVVVAVFYRFVNPARLDEAIAIYTLCLTLEFLLDITDLYIQSVRLSSAVGGGGDFPTKVQYLNNCKARLASSSRHVQRDIY